MASSEVRAWFEIEGCASPKSEGRTLGETLNTWVQTIAIVSAGVWAGYVFIYNEIMVPKAAPTNVSMTVQLSKGGTVAGDSEKPLVVVEMKVTATNPSPRKVFLLRNAWIAYGRKARATEAQKDFFQKQVNNPLLLQQPIFTVESHAQQLAPVVVAVGNLFADNELRPGETISRTVLFHVPARTYHWVDVTAVMPSVAKAGVIGLRWKVGDDGVLRPDTYALDPQGNPLGPPLTAQQVGALDLKEDSAHAVAAVSLADN